MKEDYLSGSEEETRSVARRFSAQLQRGDIVTLFGDLGSGKTQFVKGVCEALNVRDLVTSPTFVFLNRYAGRGRDGKELLVYHFDLYRVASPEEIYDLGYEEFFYDEGVSVIEWADRLGALLPRRRYHVSLAFGARENERQISVEFTNGGNNVARQSFAGRTNT